MNGQDTFYGTSSTLTGEEALLRLEAAISEGIPAAAPQVANLWGRLPAGRVTADLSLLSGLAATGLRCAALLDGPDLINRQPILQALNRQLLPVVLHLMLPGHDSRSTKIPSGHHAYHNLDSAGQFQFFAAGAQEALDLALIAHRVAELSLVPGIVALDHFTRQSVKVPTRDQLLQFLGNPDDLISCPTPAQRILFGKARRRLPNWFNVDLPGLLGVARTGADQVLATAARQQYIQRHLPDILVQVFVDFENVFGRSYSSLGAYQAEKADYLILTQGAAFGPAMEAVDYLRLHDKAKVGCLNLRQLRPFPVAALAALLSGKKALTVLEPVDASPAAGGPLYREISAALAGQTARMPALFAGTYGAELSTEAIVRAFRNSMRGGDGLRHFFLDVAFTRPSSSSPQHEVLLQTISREYPDLARLTLTDHSTPPATDTRRQIPAVPELPQAVRRYRDQGPPYTQVARFFHHTAAFHHAGEKPELVADPFQALETAPPATALLGMPFRERDKLPVFRPENCTGCGRCTVYCPHAALPPLAIGLEALINGGMRIAAARGDALSQFIPLVKNLARLAVKAIQTAGQPMVKAGDFLPSAFEKLLTQSAFPEEKEAQIRREWSILLPTIAELPAAITETFFTIPEQREKGTGALFSLAVDPTACTGCGLCAEVCETDAFDLAPATPEQEDTLRGAYSLWEQLPDTAPEWIQRLVSDPSYDSFAAIMLSRHYYQSMAGGSSTESGAPAKTMLHLVASLTESIVQPRVIQQTRKLDELIEKLSTAIHTRLSDALPHDNFQPLEQAIRDAGDGPLSLEELAGRLGAGEHFHRIDTEGLRRKVELVNDLQALRRTLTEGPTGGGRSRVGMVVQKDAWPWVGTFPDNPFLTPVVLEEESALAGRMTGLLEGHLRHALDQIRLLRRARLEARDQYRPDTHAREIAGLTWEDLEEEEKGYVAPLLLVGNGKLLERRLPELAALLQSNRPVKILVLDAGTPSGPEEIAASQPSGAALYSLLVQQEAFVLQGVPEPDTRLFAGLQQGLHTSRPALFRLFAPLMERHRSDGPTWPDLSAQALRSRAFPAITCVPEGADGRPADLSLDGNPEAEADWCTIAMQYSEEGQEKTMAYTLTYADWLFTQESWREHFSATPATLAGLVPLAGYLALDAGARSGKTPVVFTLTPEGERLAWVVSDMVIRATQAAARQWSLLQSMGGVVAAFPQKIRRQLTQELGEAHAAELANVKAAYETQLRQQEQELMELVKIRLREKLLALSQQR